MVKPAFSIYDASAGAGKTYTLVLEYLKIILTAPRDDAYRNILAITFTNKAVHEMKTRVVNSLSAFATDETPPKFVGLLEHIASDLGVSTDDVKRKSKRIIRHIIHNYAAFDISTIDKFTHRVIRTFAHDLDLPVTFEVTLDTENLLAEAVDALIAQAGEDETLTRLLVDFTMEKTDDDKSWDISRELLETGKLILNENNRAEIGHFRDRSIAEFNAVKDKIRNECRQLEQESIKLANEALDLIRANGIEFKSFYRGYVPNHFEKIAAGTMVRNVNYYKYLEEIECKRCSASTPGQQKALVDQIADELLDKLRCINEIVSKYMFYQAFLKNITPLSLLNTVEKELTRIREEQNVLSIAEFNKLINDQIRDQPAPFIYERLGEKYRHYFIDEFQDTSELQWQNLVPLINNATSSEWNGERGTLMIVGDPKQSIYRWRGGKAEQFIELAKGKHPFNNKDWKLFNLETNYRSYSQVIDFNNEFFQGLSSEFDHPDYAELYLSKTYQKNNPKSGGYVNISFIENGDDESKDEVYIRKVIETIEAVRAKGFSYSDIAILTRKRSQGVAVASALTQLKIQIISSETLLIENASEVRFVADLLHYLKNPKNREAQANFLQFLALRQQAMPVHDFIAAGMTFTRENQLESWLEEMGYTFSFSAVRKKSLYEAVELIIEAFVDDRDNAYVQYFLDIVLERDIKGMSGIADFLEFWDRTSSSFSIPAPEGEDAVRIMTIHKSKGLEFPVVIFPFAEEEFHRKPKEKLWVEADQEVFGLPKVLIDNSSQVEEFGEEASGLYQLKKQEALLDTINVLYVALTRAEEQLYVISSMNLSSKGEMPKNNLCSFFIKYLQQKEVFDENVLEYHFGSPEKVSEGSALSDRGPVIKSATTLMPPSSIKIAKRESAMWGTNQLEAIDYGNLIHQIMAWVRFPSDVDNAISTAVESGLISSLHRDQVLSTVKAIVTHSELSDHFQSDGIVYNEQDIIRPSGGVLKPDRISTIGDSAFVLDYKTGAPSPHHAEQVDNYAEAVSGLGYHVVKKTLVYLGTDIKVINL